MSKSKIWKYVLGSHALQEILMPVGAKIMTVAEQGGDLVLWAVVPFPEQRREPVKFRIIVTDQEFESADIEAMSYVGTAQIGVVVTHVFELKSRGPVDVGNGGRRP